MGKQAKKKKFVLMLMAFFMLITQASAIEKVVIDHCNWDPSGIDIAILDRIRTLKIIHLERSIGANIAAGLRHLRDANPVRYALNMTHAPIDPNIMGQPGYGYNFISKVAGYTRPRPVDPFLDTFFFDQKMRSADDAGREWGKAVAIAEFNVGWSGITSHTNVDSFLVYYTTTIESLIAAYPKCKFVFYTCCLKTPKDCTTEKNKLDQIARHEFNERLRAYIDRKGGYLFDIADLQAHDVDGVMQTFHFKGVACPVLWHVPENEEHDGWSDATSHLNARGRERMALAKWKLWAAIINKELPAEH